MTFIDDEHSENPEHPAPKKFEFLSTEVLERIEVTRQRIIEAHGENQATSQAIDSLNNELLEKGILGRTARLTSEFATVTASALEGDEKNIEPVFDPEVLSMTSFEGIFMGCDAVMAGGRVELVYSVELPIDEETWRYKTVTAPVEMASLEIEESAGVLEDADLFYEGLKVFSVIDNEKIQKDVERLKRCYEEAQQFDASFLRKMASIVNHMLTYPEIKDNEEMLLVLEDLFLGVIDLDKFYALKGIHADIVKKDDTVTVNIYPADMIAEIQAVCLTHNFDFNPKNGEESKLYRDYQVYYLVSDSNRVEYTVPVQYITEFTEIDHKNGEMYPCESSRYRFLQVYSDVFTKK